MLAALGGGLGGGQSRQAVFRLLLTPGEVLPLLGEFRLLRGQLLLLPREFGLLAGELLQPLGDVLPLLLERRRLRLQPALLCGLRFAAGGQISLSLGQPKPRRAGVGIETGDLGVERRLAAVQLPLTVPQVHGQLHGLKPDLLGRRLIGRGGPVVGLTGFGHFAPHRPPARPPRRPTRAEDRAGWWASG